MLNAIEIDNYKRFKHPYQFKLKYIDWLLFGTLTWNDEIRRAATELGRNLRHKDFINLITSVRSTFVLRDIPYYFGQEHKVGECHFHFLIAKRGMEKIDTDELIKFMYSKSINIGRADFQHYDSKLPGVDYCLKRELDSPERFDGLSKPLLRLINNQSVI